MKRFIPIVVISFIFLSCSDDKNTSPTTPPITIKEYFKGLSGTYKINFFGSEITEFLGESSDELFDKYNDYYITNNCIKASELLPDTINIDNKNKCNEEEQINLLDNQSVINIANDNMYITAKLQTNGGITDKYFTYKYQYISFNPSDELNGIGIKVYYYDYYDKVSDNVSINYKEYQTPYYVTKIDDNIIKINFMYDRQVIALDKYGNKMDVNTKNTLILEKIDNNTIELINSNNYPF